MALKVKAKGGKGGNKWDDGPEYHDVTKIHVRGGHVGIQFVKFEYLKDGQIVVGTIHGVSDRGMTQTFEINHLHKEYLLSVEGYYDESTGVIQSLQFKTNLKTSDLMGYNEGSKFSIEVAGKKIVGFHGLAEKNVYSLGAYFTKVPSTKSAIEGGKTTGKDFDDGGENDGIRKVYVNHDGTAVRYVKFVYDKAGNEVVGEHGERIGSQHEFTVNYPYEHIISVEGSYAVTQPYGCIVLRSLIFKTSSGRTSELIGKVIGTTFVLESKGNIIDGFHGRVGSCVDGIGAYYSPLPPQADLALKMEAKGGKGGKKWDDGYNYNDVTKIHVHGGLEGIQFVKIEYVKDEKTVVGQVHGVSDRGMTEIFDVNHLNKEYLISVEGYYDESTGVIQSLKFTTNIKTSDFIGYNDQGTKFSLSASRTKIIGFHGFAEKSLNSLGAYFVRYPSTKSAIQGGQTTGRSFDDGGDFDGIRKVYVNHDGTAIRYVKFVYDRAGEEIIRARGDNIAFGESCERIGEQHEFTVNYPYEHITSVEGSYAFTQLYGSILLRSLTFKTSNGRTSQIGTVTGTPFVLESKGNSIVGFHGRVGSCVDGIGAYYSPLHLPPSPPSEKLGGKGGDGGDSWDDGAFKSVKKVYVGQGDISLASVKFEYVDESSEVVFGKEHGKKTLLEYDKFELDYPSEYIISVEGCYDKVVGAESEVITMLRFKTNKRTSTNFGLESEFSFVLHKDGHKITGFHGKSSTVIHQIGVHVAPIID